MGSLATGSRIYLDLADPAQRNIFFTGGTEWETTRLFHRLAVPGWTVIDVGANVGYYTLLARDLGGPSANVHAFEPNPPVAALLHRSVSAEAANAVTICEAGCGASAGTAQLYVGSNSAEYPFSSLRSDIGGARGWSSIEIEIFDLDGYCAKNALMPHLVKIDAEGYEPEVLNGMERLLEDAMPAYVICEVVPGHPRRPDPKSVIEKLGNYGYRCCEIRENGVLVEAGEVEAPGNVCFVAPGRPLV
jgi:FkbM family methyltransferase